jgi:hypothetical protein
MHQEVPKDEAEPTEERLGRQWPTRQWRTAQRRTGPVQVRAGPVARPAWPTAVAGEAGLPLGVGEASVRATSRWTRHKGCRRMATGRPACR